VLTLLKSEKKKVITFSSVYWLEGGATCHSHEIHQ